MCAFIQIWQSDYGPFLQVQDAKPDLITCSIKLKKEKKKKDIAWQGIFAQPCKSTGSCAETPVKTIGAGQNELRSPLPRTQSWQRFSC